VAKPSPAKVSVECPHCGFKQMEYVAAKSTLCRQCGRYFSPSAPKPGLKLRTKEQTAAAQEPSGLRKLEGFWNKQRTRVVACFECKRKHEVSDAAISTNCPGCSAHIDLRDYKITTSFSRSIRTRGEVHLTAKGDLSSTSVICKSALLEGKLREVLVRLGDRVSAGQVLARTDDALIDLVRHGQGVLNIVPLGPVVGELDSRIVELQPDLQIASNGAAGAGNRDAGVEKGSGSRGIRGLRG